MSSSDERSPKRQRRSYSPESPLPDAGKPPVVQPPQTPPPSVHMSPSWGSAQLPGLGTVGAASAPSAAAAATTSASTTNTSFPTPPSTAGLNSQAMARVASNEGRTGESAQHTPTSEAEQQRTGLGEQVMSEAQSDSAMDVTMADEGEEHRRTDHEREEGEDTVPPLPGANVLYKLSVDPIAPARPLFSQNAIELYGLQHIQASVARKDAAGVKINKLRKSYEGKLAQFKLEGRNKSTKQEGWFTGFLHPGWDVQFEDGRTMWDLEKAEFKPGVEESDERIFSLLDRALDLKAGHLPKKEHDEWRNLTGLDDPAGLAKATPIPAAASAFSKPPPPVSGPSSRPAPGPSAVQHQQYAVDSPKTFHNNPARPDRQGKKRRYDERSYEGYNDGYEDDGYDTGGVDEAGRRGSGGKRQKRKDFTPSNSPPFATPSGANSNMVGVRSS